MFDPLEERVYEPRQRAVILWNGQEEILLLSTDQRSTRASMVLEVFPFPERPSVRLGDFETFERAQRLATKKRMWSFAHPGAGGGAAPGGDAHATSTPPSTASVGPRQARTTTSMPSKDRGLPLSIEGEHGVGISPITHLHPRRPDRHARHRNPQDRGALGKQAIDVGGGNMALDHEPVDERRVAPLERPRYLRGRLHLHERGLVDIPSVHGEPLLL